MVALILAAMAADAAATAPPPATRAEAPLPAEVQAMLDAALKSGSESDVATVSRYARAAAPQSADRIADLVSGWAKQRAAAQQATLRDAGLLDLWKGRAELGGYRTTGNSDTVGVSGALNLERDGLRWRQKLHLAAEYQESRGVTDREHYVASYESNYKFDPRAYLYGQAQFESDHFLGFDTRYSASLGGGYSAIKTPALTLDVELGPAFRATDYTDGRDETSLAARGSLGLGWKLASGLSFRQDASAYVERYTSTVTSTSALQAKLIGPLSAQLSYNVQYESLPSAGTRNTDTTTRGSLVYSF